MSKKIEWSWIFGDRLFVFNDFDGVSGDVGGVGRFQIELEGVARFDGFDAITFFQLVRSLEPGD